MDDLDIVGLILDNLFNMILRTIHEMHIQCDIKISVPDMMSNVSERKGRRTFRREAHVGLRSCVRDA